MKILLSDCNTQLDELVIIKSFLSGKDVLFHLRRYDWEEDQVADFLSQFTNEELEKIVLNHHHFLATEFGINRLHFSEQDRREIDEEKLQRFADAGFILSTSVHELETFNKLPACFTYAFLSPVFDSISKAGYKAVNFDLSHRRKDIQLIGLGGVTAENFSSLITMGFNGGAVLGAVWNSENPFIVIDSLKKLNELKSKIGVKSSETRHVKTEKAQFTSVNEQFSVKHNDVNELLKQSKPYVLTIAGFDPCGGAGILADVKTAEFNGCMGMAVITANTIQTEDAFFSIGWVDEVQILNQLETLLQKYSFNAVKIGIVESFEVLRKIILLVRTYQPDVFIVWDTVLAASAGVDFVSNIQQETLITVLKSVNLITPNAKEVVRLTANADELESAKWLSQHTSVLLKGGHRATKLGVDTLFLNDEEIEFLPEKKEGITPKHGSGCMLSSAIAAQMALGKSIAEACELAKRFIEKQLSSNQTLLAYYA